MPITLGRKSEKLVLSLRVDATLIKAHIMYQELLDREIGST